MYQHYIKEFIMFGLKQARACIFGIFLLLIMIVSNYWYPLDWLHRYDFIFLAAVAFQLLLLATKLETLKESLVIVIFHVVATGMELFKTSDAIGSWVYPENYIFGVGNVPLFAGFMYSAVGSYIARVWRIFDFQYSYYPKLSHTVLLVVLIYINFFSHHFFYDVRWLLVASTVLIFLRTKIHYKITSQYWSMPVLLGWLLVALFIWFAENIATYTNIWIYPNQKDSWDLVPLAKLSSWYLLMILSFVLVSLVSKPKDYLANKRQRRSGL